LRARRRIGQDVVIDLEGGLDYYSYPLQRLPLHLLSDPDDNQDTPRRHGCARLPGSAR
jgi:hypothetical protein